MWHYLFTNTSTSRRERGFTLETNSSYKFKNAAEISLSQLYHKARKEAYLTQVMDYDVIVI